MAVKKLLRMGHPLLRQKASLLTIDELRSEAFQELLADMRETMTHAGGIGLAAPQIGVSKQVAIIHIPEYSKRYPGVHASDSFIVVNPVLTVLDQTTQGFWEGCLSVPGLRGFVERPRKIRVDYLDEQGQPHSLEVEDFLATVFQHELDHLFGTLYVDHIKDMTKLSFNEEFDQFVAAQAID